MAKPIDDVTLFPLIKEIVADPSYAKAALPLAAYIDIKVQSRDPNRPFTVKTFEPGNNKIRMDLAWAAAGAAFGSASLLDRDSRPDYNVDKSLLAMLNATVVKNPISEKEAKALWVSGKPGYDRWTKMFQPREGLRTVRIVPYTVRKRSTR